MLDIKSSHGKNALTRQSGVTVVQYRDKTSDTGVLVQTATKLHEITKQYGVPLVINDRVDVAVASGAEGVHLGQDDMCIDLRLSEHFCPAPNISAPR